LFSRNHPALSRRVLVSLLSGNAIQGVMSEQLGDHYVLKGCVVLEPGRDPVEAVGEMVIDRSNVDYMQITEA
jgi:hypothetical protein